MSFVEKVGRMRGKRVGGQGSLTSGCQLPISEPPPAHPHSFLEEGAWLRTVRGARDYTHTLLPSLGAVMQM